MKTLKKTFVGTAVAGIMTLLLSGCGNTTPEETAEAFAKAVSVPDFSEAEKLASKQAQKRILDLKKRCYGQLSKRLADEAASVLKNIEISKHTKEYKESFAPVLRQSRKRIKQLKSELEAKIQSKYGPKAYVPQEEREEMTVDLFVEMIMPLVEKEIELFGIKSLYPADLKKTLALFSAYSNGSIRLSVWNFKNLYLAAGTVIMEKQPEITPACIDKYTDFGYIKKITVIETNSEAPDKKQIRMEILKHNGSSGKTTIQMEKILDQWKVADFTLHSTHQP